MLTITIIMQFTIAFASTPVLVQGLTEQPFSKEELLAYPHLYQRNRRNGLITWKVCGRWFVVGIWHVVICYYVPKFVWMDSSSVVEYGGFNLFISSVVLVIVDVKVSAIYPTSSLLVLNRVIINYSRSWSTHVTSPC